MNDLVFGRIVGRLLAAVGLFCALSGWVVAPAAGQQVAPTPGAEDETGFEAIFDGKTLAGWEGDAKYWRVADGALVGEITPETILKQNSFII